MQNFAATFKSQLSGLSVKFSPFKAERLAFSSANNFGIIGKGQLLILEIQPNGIITVVRQYEHKDAVFDCSWTEFNENLIISASGDGSIYMWDILQNKLAFELKGHQGEIQSIECSHFAQNLFLSSGADTVIRLWDIQKQSLVSSFPNAHLGQIFKTTWHPSQQTLFASIATDGFLKIWDLRSPNKQIAAVKAHMSDILSCDFNKYDEIIATGSTDKTIRIWDLRKLQNSVNMLAGHRYPVRSVKFSPHSQQILASGSYDMNVNIWDIYDQMNPLKFCHKSHTEFVTCLDFNIFVEKQLCSSSWDGRVLIWNWDQQQPVAQ